MFLTLLQKDLPKGIVHFWHICWPMFGSSIFNYIIRWSSAATRSWKDLGRTILNNDVCIFWRFLKQIWWYLSSKICCVGRFFGLEAFVGGIVKGGEDLWGKYIWISISKFSKFVTTSMKNWFYTNEHKMISARTQPSRKEYWGWYFFKLGLPLLVSS